MRDGIDAFETTPDEEPSGPAGTGPGHELEAARTELELARVALAAARGPSQRPRRRGRPVVVALSGVDGSGKTTLSRRLMQEFEQAGVEAARIWSRPGYGLGLLGQAIDAVKRLTRSNTSSGVKRIATQSGPAPASRRGAVGWLWALVVTLAYIRDVRRQHSRAHVVAICDRYRHDAEVTLDVFYGGGDRRLHKLLLRWLLPAPDLAFYLEVDAETALARKPNSTFGRFAIEEQLEHYRVLDDGSRTILDGALSGEQLAGQVLRQVAAHVAWRRA